MTLLLKFCLILVGIASVGSVIGLPIALTAGGKGGVTTNSSLGGGTSQVSITMCSDQLNPGWEEVEFGSQNEGEVCWDIKSGQKNTDNSEDYSGLFKEKWGEGQTSWSTSSKQGSSWKTVCGSNWTISAGTGGEEYLGTCDLKQGTLKSFVKKNKQKKSEVENAKKEVKLAICSGECFSVGSEQFMKNLENPVQDKWQEIIFKSKKKTNLKAKS